MLIRGRTALATRIQRGALQIPRKSFGPATSSKAQDTHQFEFALHDLVPKDKLIRVRPENSESTFNPHNLGLMQNILYQLKLSNEDAENDIEGDFSFWEQLSREAVAQIKSFTFRDQFYKLVQNDDIHLAMLSVHLFLIAE